VAARAGHTDDMREFPFFLLTRDVVDFPEQLADLCDVFSILLPHPSAYIFEWMPLESLRSSQSVQSLA
jgi:hypothetical protein